MTALTLRDTWRGTNEDRERGSAAEVMYLGAIHARRCHGQYDDIAYIGDQEKEVMAMI